MVNMLRPIKPSSSHISALSIEAWFTFPEVESEGDMIAVAGTFNQLCFKSFSNEMLLRLKLEAKLTVTISPPECSVRLNLA